MWRRCSDPAASGNVVPYSENSKISRCLSYRRLLRLLALTPFLVWRFVDQPASTVIPTASVLICSYLLCWTISISKGTGTGTDAVLCVAYLPTLAFMVTREVSPFAGLVARYLGTVYAAGMCGYALGARYRLFDDHWSEEASTAAAAGHDAARASHDTGRWRPLLRTS